MPAPIAISPLVWKAAQLGSVAAITWYVSRRKRDPEPRDIWREQALNDVSEGVEADTVRHDGEVRTDIAGRIRRTVRMGVSGPGVEIDGTLLGRLRFRRV